MSKFLYVNAHRIPYRAYIFSNPVETLVLENPEKIPEFFTSLENRIKKGFYLCGFLSYELGYFLEPALIPYYKKDEFGFPLALFHIYSNKEKIKLFPEKIDLDEFKFLNLSLNISKEEYLSAINKIKKYIAQGDTYQINFTFKVKFDFKGNPEALFKALLFSQRCEYAFFLEYKNIKILSLSPERFLQKRDSVIRSSPMKGTLKRSPLLNEDQRAKKELKEDLKTQAENVMIVDLIRNDLGRICENGSVRVRELFKVKTYPTLHQLISTVEGVLKIESIFEVFKALFPCGSVTGAPKIRSMQIISELEKEPRRVYTGAVGFFTPEGNFLFNVGIRTLVLWKRGEDDYSGEAGIGSGVVWDSRAVAEYDECILKARFFTSPVPYFALIETFYCEKRENNLRIPLLKYHYERLKESAEFFRFKKPGCLFSLKSFRTYISEKLKHLLEGKFKVKILLFPEGRLEISVHDFEEWKKDLKILLVKRDFKADVFCFHKTTLRSHFDRWLSFAKEKGFDEVVFYDEEGKILEGTISSFFIKFREKNTYFTPPLSSGILNGVLRKFLIEKREAEERKMKLEDLEKAEEIYIGNAVRGLGKVKDWSKIV